MSNIKFNEVCLIPIALRKKSYYKQKLLTFRIENDARSP